MLNLVKSRAIGRFLTIFYLFLMVNDIKNKMNFQKNKDK